MNKEKLIIVCGQDDARKSIIMRMLVSDGLAPENVVDLFQIVKSPEAGNYKVIIIDLNGITRDPSSIIQDIKKKNRNACIIILSELSNIYAFGQSLEDVSNALLIEPLNLEALIDIVDKKINTITKKHKPGSIEIKPQDTKIIPSPSPELHKNKLPDHYKKKIITIGSGKGGVGKSIITANIATALAYAGKHVIVVDCDLGSPGLHTLFGIETLQYTLFDFLLRKKMSLAKVAQETDTPGVKIIGITEDFPGSANIKHVQKIKLIQNLQKLEADYILVDLGSGIYFDTIDLFLISRNGIIVTSPEKSSIVNTYRFIKSAFYREIENCFKKNKKNNLLDLIRKAADSKNDLQTNNMSELETLMTETNNDAGTMLSEIKNNFSPRLIVNMVKKYEGNMIGETIKTDIKKQFNIDIELLGSVVRETSVESSVANMTRFLLTDPESSASGCIRSIVNNLNQ